MTAEVGFLPPVCDGVKRQIGICCGVKERNSFFSKKSKTEMTASVQENIKKNQLLRMLDVYSFLDTMKLRWLRRININDSSLKTFVLSMYPEIV